MGRQVEVFDFSEFVVFGKRFLFVNVQTRSRNLAAFESLHESRLLDDSTPGAIEYANSVLHLGERILIHHVFRLLGHGHVNCQIVCP